ncbi:hypothetical protein ISF_02299 [Cordyceps fumosorosea ARSEF 2679]|uniref:Uncharacterized protein n=1 Tax=Cordyceps fumosorosea (strain ARSEF 2679) TaxID=1081104 RepID=A0A168BMX8_CORFA|nr:hypothetical protein ISF_02299 [Cordyceps fumosorosea ARSEF 2679]OAA70325.1 hypothetical protein ISF_02299 [Cordyceps fumosorosea ARSEF 2679]
MPTALEASGMLLQMRLLLWTRQSPAPSQRFKKEATTPQRESENSGALAFPCTTLGEPIYSEGDRAEVVDTADAYVTRMTNAALRKRMELKSSIVQALLDRIISERLQDLRDSATAEIKQKLNDSELEDRVKAALKTKLAPYEALMDDYERLASRLIYHCDTADQLRVRRTKLMDAGVMPPTAASWVSEDIGLIQGRCVILDGDEF